MSGGGGVGDVSGMVVVCGKGVVVVVNNERGNRNVLKATTWKKKRLTSGFPCILH